jgi:ABC-2 type transport system ATP-binding protein
MATRRPWRSVASPAMLVTMIHASSLTKRYGGRAVVQDVSFSCSAGTVTGFLGPNGAGKSTTLKMLCGLARPSSGSSTLLDLPYERLPNPGRHVGVLIDASAAHAGRRGRETLALSAQLLGVPGTRVDEMLELVGLDHAAAHKRVGQYSLGMRQRLGIAHALLGDPEVLILDEPANGLDPEGMRWMRGLLREFAQRGGTVLLSSHLLHEVEAIADRLIIIADGTIAAQGTHDDLVGDRASTRVRSADDPALLGALRGASLKVSHADDAALLVDARPDVVGDVALAAGVALRELGSTQGAGLEQLFFSLTEHSRSEAPVASPPLPVPAMPSKEVNS